MEILLDKINDTEALIKITLNEDDYQKGVEEKIKDYSKKANIKGFRPGKVPTGMIKKMYGKSILVDEINHLLSHKLMDYLKESDLQVLGEPIPNFEKASQVDWDNQKDFEFEYNIGFAKDFSLVVDKKIKVDKHTIKIDSKLIDETIGNIQNQFGNPVNPDTIEQGDSVYGKLIGGAFEKETTLELHQLEKTVAKKFLGKGKGEEIAFDLKKAFKDSHDAEHLLGHPENLDALIKEKFTFTIQHANRVEPADINEELFKKAFPNEEIKSEEDFRNRVQEIISENYEKEEEFLFNQKIREKLIEKAAIDLPDEFLKRWLMEKNEELTDSNIGHEYGHYASELKWSLVKNLIAKEQDIKVGHEEIVAEAKHMIKMQFAGSGIMGDQFESSLDSFADNYLKGENGDNYSKVHNQVYTNKIYVFIKENITSKEKAISLDEFRKL